MKEVCVEVSGWVMMGRKPNTAAVREEFTPHTCINNNDISSNKMGVSNMSLISLMCDLKTCY